MKPVEDGVSDDEAQRYGFAKTVIVLALAIAFVAFLVWIASNFGATKAGFLGASAFFGAVQLACLFIFHRSWRPSVRVFCLYTILLCIYVEIVALASAVAAPR